MPQHANTRREFVRILGSAAALSLVGCRRQPESDTVVLRLGHCSVPGKPLFDAAKSFAQIVNREVDSRVRIDVFPEGKLGDSRLVMESTAIGTLDMSCEAPLSPIVPEMALLELPYLFVDDRHAATNLEGPFGQALAKRAEARGLTVLGYYTDAGRSIFNRYRDVHSPDDLRGLKIRVPEGKVWLEMMNRFGAIGIPLSWGEVYTAIEQNVIAGAETDLISIERACLHETCKHISQTNHVLLVYPHIMNRHEFEALRASDRRLLKRACREAARLQRERIGGRLAEARRRLESQGASILDVDESLFRDRVLAMHDRYARELRAEDVLSMITPPSGREQARGVGRP
ncbi:MAG TPA: hypothetical protein DD670_12595 [Planctomycetaceae bacterium]|nr:hypothetical protein [Planctomycetaceae bacterium]